MEGQDTADEAAESRARMRIAVLGATGRTGQLLLAQAREKGLQVNALARHPERLAEFCDFVTPFEGDVMDPIAVERTITNCIAVVSVLGPRRDSPTNLLTTSSLNMVSAMRKHGTRRLVILTNTAVDDPSDRLPLGQRVLRFVLFSVNERLARDSVAAALIIADSGLDWTLVRPPILTDGPKTGNYRVGALARGIPLRISRADVAEFILSCVVEGKFVHERPALGGGHSK
jgi:putative NADH-flavin reductase